MEELGIHSPPFRILVVDDNRDAANTTATLLKIWGFDVRVVYSGHEALEAVRDYLPHCILSDINLPGVDGYRLAELIRQDAALKDIPLVAISACYDPEKLKVAFFDHQLVKPVEPNLLKDMLKRILTMDKRLQSAEALIQKQGEVVVEARDLLKEVKNDVKEMKQELREVKEDVKDIKEELREVKDKKD